MLCPLNGHPLNLFHKSLRNNWKWDLKISLRNKKKYHLREMIQPSLVCTLISLGVYSFALQLNTPKQNNIFLYNKKNT